MTQQDIPTGASVPTATAADVDPGSGTTEAPPPPRRKRVGPVVGLLLAIVSLVFSVVQFAGGIGELGDLFGPGKVPGERIASQVSGTGGSGYWICGDLRAEVGATASCWTPSDRTAGIRATVTAVDGDVVSYDLESS